MSEPWYPSISSVGHASTLNGTTRKKKHPLGFAPPKPRPTPKRKPRKP